MRILLMNIITVRPEWFLDNATRYDNYDRKSVSKVFAGEYAAQSDRTTSPDNKNNWYTALTEAAFLTGLERNADVVQMASYAPLFGHVDGWQWKPDLIWVDNLRVLPTPNYFVQKLYATNKGSHTVSMLTKDNVPATGQDSLYASATLDKTTNELIIKIVNVAGKVQLADMKIEGVNKVQSKAKLTVLQNDNVASENSFDSGLKVAPVETEINTKGKTIAIELKAYSFSVIRVRL